MKNIILLNPPILNREFKHPADGWYMIEPVGDHPNRSAGLVQVIDADAITSIVNRFNADAEAGRLSHGHEMLIDHEHFKHDPDKETVAYGWAQKLDNRADGIYARVRWTGTGQTAVDGGDYRFFSTEYDPADLKVLNDGKVKRVRPLKLDGLTLTNDPNNKGGRPITNRNNLDTPPGSGASSSQTKNTPNKMKQIATELGLDANTDEVGILAVVRTLKNRGDITATDLATLRNRATALETENQTLLGEQVDTIMDAHGIKADDKVRNRLRPVLAGLKNREDRTAALADFGFKPVEAAKTASPQIKLHNRETRQPAAGKTGTEDSPALDQAKADKITNRANQLLKEPNMTMTSAYRMAQAEIEAAG